LVERREVKKANANFSMALCLEVIIFKDEIEVGMCEMDWECVNWIGNV